MSTHTPKRGAKAAVARSKSKVHNKKQESLTATAASPATRTKKSTQVEKLPPVRSHPLSKPRCRAATTLARQCTDAQQLSELPADLFSVFVDDPEKFLSFVLHIRPKESLWKGATFAFRCLLPTKQPRDYPYQPPVPVAFSGCRYYHPNINLKTQKVTTKGLVDSWSPKLGLKGFCWLLHDLLIAPDPQYPANKRAARDMIDNPDKFQRDVQGSLNGSRVLIKVHSQKPPEEHQFPTRFGQAKIAAKVPKRWQKVR